MAIIFTRQPSETPIIKNSDDCILFRYAVSNQNGYIKSKGLECGYQVIGLKFKITSGKLVCQGYDVEIDSNGAEVTIDNIATKRYYSVYCQINLALQKVEIKTLYDTAGFPVISNGDDLTANTSGTANLELYQFTATSGAINSVTKVIKEIGYNIAVNQPQSDRSNKIANTEYVRQAISDSGIKRISSPTPNNSVWDGRSYATEMDGSKLRHIKFFTPPSDKKFVIQTGAPWLALLELNLPDYTNRIGGSVLSNGLYTIVIDFINDGYVHNFHTFTFFIITQSVGSSHVFTSSAPLNTINTSSSLKIIGNLFAELNSLGRLTITIASNDRAPLNNIVQSMYIQEIIQW